MSGKDAGPVHFYKMDDHRRYYCETPVGRQKRTYSAWGLLTSITVAPDVTRLGVLRIAHVGSFEVGRTSNTTRDVRGPFGER